MKNKTLHIISFDIPYPADYGGVIDVYYKLKALKDCGLDIILHCFYKQRKPADILDELCKEVHYYQRGLNPYFIFSSKPFILASRKDHSLLDILLRDEYPVLFEGLHTTYLLKALRKSGKKSFVRTHNIEHDYYRDLAKSERSLLRKAFFRVEAWKLKNFESILSDADGLIAISKEDENHFKAFNKNTIFIPPFHPEPKAISALSPEKYAFYHGNFEVSENRRAAEFLINRVLQDFNLKLVIAGKSVNKLGKMAGGKKIILVDSPTEDEMLKWASRAAVHLLPTFQPTGFKLKFLYSLYTAKSIIANENMVHGTGLEGFVHLANSVSEWKAAINLALENPGSEPVIFRDKALSQEVSNKALAERLIQFLR